MLELPSKDSLNGLLSAMHAIAPATAVGLARAREGGEVAISYTYAHGFGELLLAAADVPRAILPAGDEPGDGDAPTLAAQRARAMEAFLLDNQTRRLVSVRLAGIEPATRVWIGLSRADALTATELAAVARIAGEHAGALTRPLTPDQELRRLRRLEQAAELIPALLHVLDVREVMDRVSAAAKTALPHDLLILSLFAEDLSTFTVYARSDQGAGLGTVQPNVYPASTIKAWTFAVVNDHALHPFEREAPSTKVGVRSSLRFPIRFASRVLAGIAFGSFTAHAFTEADVPIGKRLADHVASALSHFQMAERIAEQARVTEELRARATNIQLLDELLTALVDTGDLADVFARISAIAHKVLPHDAAALLIHLPDGRHGRVYASHGYPADLPGVVEIPEDILGNPDWEHDIFDDVSAVKGPIDEQLTALGLRSLLRVPIRFDGGVAGALTFAARATAAFKAADVPIARRMADRLAITLVRSREVEASRRADEAATRAARLEARVQALTQELDARTGYRRVIGESLSWRQVLTQATQVAATETTALLLGESGTGKEVVARFVHRASPRSNGPFVALNCAALPEQLLEAELFGYERGAFTGATQSKPGQLEQAAGGTLFLDEVGEMSLPAQAKFLRVLQEREFQRLGGTRVLRTDARIVAATNRDLLKAVANGQFREDLFYRLNVFAIRLPPLRDRTDDILPLTQAFLTEFGRAFANPPAGISREAKQMLLAYHWPGNIRELRNILERAAILCDGGLITDDHLALPGAPASPLSAPAQPPAARVVENAAAAPAPAPGDVAGRDLQSVERAMIEQALRNARFNKSKAAKELGLTRHQLYIRMRRHGLEN